MKHPEITFSEDGAYVSIWVGSFGSQRAVTRYTKEQYDEEREDEPISEFAADIGLKYYNHDFIEVHFEKGLPRRKQAVFTRHSYGHSFAALCWERIEKLDIKQFDSVFLLYGYNHPEYPQSKRQPQRVRFIGTFQYKM